MELGDQIYPMRAVVRCKAKNHLLRLAAEDYEALLPIDEPLLMDIASTFSQSVLNRELCQSCHSHREAAQIEDKIALQLAETYKQIKLQQTNPLVQNLNALL